MSDNWTPTVQQWWMLTCAVIGGMLIGILAYHVAVVDRETLPIRITVEDYSGFALGENALNFGSVSPGGHSVRDLLLRNHASHPVLIYLQPISRTEDWFSIDRQWVVLQPDTVMKVPVHAWVPYDAPYGNYTGELRTTTYRWW